MKATRMKNSSVYITRKAALSGVLCAITCTLIIYRPVLHRTPAPKLSAFELSLAQMITAAPDRSPGQVAGSTIDDSLQKVVTTDVYNRMIQTSSKQALAVLMDTNTGAIKAITSQTNPNPTICQWYETCRRPDDNMATTAWEPGSVMKPLLVAAALNQDVISPSSSYYEKGFTYVGGRLYINAEGFPPQRMTIQDILNKSLNTGAIHVLRTIGGGDINQKVQDIWFDYLTTHYHFGTKTGIGLPNEAAGDVRPPRGGHNVQTQYAGSAFGVGLTMTPLQLVAAYGAIVNGGTYYQPNLDSSKPATVVSRQVVSSAVSATMLDMLHKTLVVNEPSAQRKGYVVGAKTGTAPVPGTDDAYKTTTNTGTYVGYVGKAKPQYILLIRLDEPHTNDFESAPARMLWADITNQLINQGRL